MPHKVLKDNKYWWFCDSYEDSLYLGPLQLVKDNGYTYRGDNLLKNDFFCLINMDSKRTRFANTFDLIALRMARPQ